MPPPKTFVSGKRVGRPPTKQNESTRLATREKVAFNRRASLMAGKLLNSQAILALGTHHMVTKTIDTDGKVHINIVRDMKRQQNLLDEGEYGKDYLIIEGTPADWRAADAILNRAWGKPKETLEIEGEVKFSLKGLLTPKKVVVHEHLDTPPPVAGLLPTED